MQQIIRLLFVCSAILSLSGACAAGTGRQTPAPPQASPGGKDYSLDPSSVEFVEVIDNPYLPLLPGSKWEYEIRRGDIVIEKDTVEVLAERREVNGIQATVVRDTVTIGDQPVEDTYDWFAQDSEGNVWYVGEAVDNYVGGLLSNHSGSWEWGVDGALPGIIMWADPGAHLNEEYYQEFYPGQAEDKGQVLSATESVTVPFGAFENVVQTYDFSSLDPRAQEHKFYAAGVGLIREMSLRGSEEMVLIAYTPPAK